MCGTVCVRAVHHVCSDRVQEAIDIRLRLSLSVLGRSLCGARGALDCLERAIFHSANRSNVEFGVHLSASVLKSPACTHMGVHA